MTLTLNDKDLDAIETCLRFSYERYSEIKDFSENILKEIEHAHKRIEKIQTETILNKNLICEISIREGMTNKQLCEEIAKYSFDYIEKLNKKYVFCSVLTQGNIQELVKQNTIENYESPYEVEIENSDLKIFLDNIKKYDELEKK